jgi:hypothetical protein
MSNAKLEARQRQIRKLDSAARRENSFSFEFQFRVSLGGSPGYLFLMGG